MMRALRAQASLFLAMEVASTKAYWHITPSKTGYDPFFSSKLMVGNMGALDVTTTTWFGTELQYVHGIQIDLKQSTESNEISQDCIQNRDKRLG